MGYDPGSRRMREVDLTHCELTWFLINLEDSERVRNMLIFIFKSRIKPVTGNTGYWKGLAA